MSATNGDNEAKSKLADARIALRALTVGSRELGPPFKDRSKAKVRELKHQILMYRATIAKRRAKATGEQLPPS